MCAVPEHRNLAGRVAGGVYVTRPCLMTHLEGFAFFTPTPDSVGSEVLAIEDMSLQGYLVMSPLKFQVHQDIEWTRMKVSCMLCDAIDSASQAVVGMLI